MPSGMGARVGLSGLTSLTLGQSPGPSVPFLSFSFSRQCTDTTQCALIAGNKSIDIISPIGNGQRRWGCLLLSSLFFLFVDQKSSTVLSIEGEKKKEGTPLAVMSSGY